jgi:AbiV family abortive infection protein
MPNATPNHSYTHEQMEGMRQQILGGVAALIEDSGLLFKNARYARAFTLAVIAIEETAKAVNLLDAAAVLDSGENPNWEQLHADSIAHRQKLMGNLLNFKRVKTEGAIPSKGSKEWQQAIEMVKTLDRRKQDGLYATFEADRVVLPGSRFTQGDAAMAIQLAMTSYNTADLQGRLYDGRRHGTPANLIDTKLRYDFSPR